MDTVVRVDLRVDTAVRVGLQVDTAVRVDLREDTVGQVVRALRLVMSSLIASSVAACLRSSGSRALVRV